MLTSLDHVIILVKELDAASEMYTALLGRSPSWRGEHPGLGTANVLFRLRNTYVELIAPVAGAVVDRRFRERLEKQGEGLIGMAFGTDDAEACFETLSSRGLGALPPVNGEGRDLDTDARRRWRNVMLPPNAARGPLVFAIQHLDAAEALPMAPLRGESAACVSGLDHVVVLSGDPEATRSFYGEALGLRLALDRVFEERRLRLLFFRVGGVTVEIAKPLDAPPSDEDRFLGPSFQVPDADAARVRVAAAGFDVSPVRPGMKPGTRVCSVRGKPLGVDTLLIEPVSERSAAVR